MISHVFIIFKRNIFMNEISLENGKLKVSKKYIITIDEI